VERAQPVEQAPGEAAAGAGGGLTLVDVRRLWPDVLEAVKLMRRYTWILLSQNAQVAAVDDKTLTVALVSAGARNSFSSGGSEEILRQAAIDVIGHDWRIESIVDPSAQPGAGGPVEVHRPAVPAADSGGQAPGQAAPSTAGRPARATEPASREPAGAGPEDGPGDGPAGPPGPAARQRSPIPDDDAERDDQDADTLAGAELLERELGASIIEEIRHD
jgi:DNA polymerase-3 subunit gamma/tau